MKFRLALRRLHRPPDGLRHRPDSVHHRTPVAPLGLTGTRLSPDAPEQGPGRRGPIGELEMGARRRGAVTARDQAVARDRVDRPPMSAPLRLHDHVDRGEPRPDQRDGFVAGQVAERFRTPRVRGISPDAALSRQAREVLRRLIAQRQDHAVGRDQPAARCPDFDRPTTIGVRSERNHLIVQEFHGDRGIPRCGSREEAGPRGSRRRRGVRGANVPACAAGSRDRSQSRKWEGSSGRALIMAAGTFSR